MIKKFFLLLVFVPVGLFLLGYGIWENYRVKKSYENAHKQQKDRYAKRQ